MKLSIVRWQYCHLILLLGLLVLLAGCSSKNTIEIDAFENMTIKYSGWNGKGTAKVENEINYVGSNSTVSNFLDSITYKVEPKKELKNGDTIKVTLVYVTEKKELANVSFKKESKTFKVNGLTDLKDRKVISKEETVLDADGKKVEVEEEYYIINGIEIPVAWNLSEEEMEDYITYKQGESKVKTKDIDEGIAPTSSWTQGTSETTTNRKNADFFVKDYLNNAVTTYQDAYDYGIKSSQEFRIEPILKKEKTVGYRVVFKDDVAAEDSDNE